MTHVPIVAAVDLARRPAWVADQIVAALDAAKAVATPAAKRLGVSRSTFDRWVAELSSPQMGDEGFHVAFAKRLARVRAKHATTLHARAVARGRKGGLVGAGGRPRKTA